MLEIIKKMNPNQKVIQKKKIQEKKVSWVKDNRNRYKEPDFEFDGIIESEGVLDIMQRGCGFLRSSNIIVKFT